MCYSTFTPKDTSPHFATYVDEEIQLLSADRIYDIAQGEVTKDDISDAALRMLACMLYSELSAKDLV